MLIPSQHDPSARVRTKKRLADQCLQPLAKFGGVLTRTFHLSPTGVKARLVQAAQLYKIRKIGVLEDRLRRHQRSSAHKRLRSCAARQLRPTSRCGRTWSICFECCLPWHTQRLPLQSVSRIVPLATARQPHRLSFTVSSTCSVKFGVSERRLCQVSGVIR